MPTYTFENTKTGKVYDEYMSISERETYLEQNPHIKQLINKINIVSGTGGMKNDSVGKKLIKNSRSTHKPHHLHKDMAKKLSNKSKLNK